MANCGCNDYSRSQLLRRAAAEAGQGLPAIEPGMPLPAGTGLTRRSFVSRATGLALAVYGAAQPRPEGVRGRDRAPRPQAPRPTRSSSRSSCRAASTRSRCSRPIGAPALRAAAARRSRCPPAQGTPFAEDPRLRWHPTLAAARRRCTARARSRSSRRSATTTPTSRTSPRATTGRSASSTRSAAGGWLGRYLDQHGVADNPLQGLDARLRPPPALAAHDVPVAAVGAARRLRLLDARRVGRPVAGQDARRASATSATPPTERRRRWRRRAARPRPTGRLRDQLGAVPGRLHDAGRRDLPERRLRPTGSRALAAMLDGGPAAAGGGDRGRAATTPTRTRLDSLPGDLREIGDSLLRLPARPRGARPRRPRARARLERVRAPAARRTAPAPTTAPPASAS